MAVGELWFRLLGGGNREWNSSADLHDMRGGSWRLGRLALMPWSKTWRPPLSWLGSGKRDETGPMVCRRSWSADHGPMVCRRQLSFCASFSLSFALFKAIASYCMLLLFIRMPGEGAARSSNRHTIQLQTIDDKQTMR